MLPTISITFGMLNVSPTIYSCWYDSCCYYCCFCCLLFPRGLGGLQSNVHLTQQGLSPTITSHTHLSMICVNGERLCTFHHKLCSSKIESKPYMCNPLFKDPNRSTVYQPVFTYVGP